MKPSVTFETKCYEADWEYLLKTGRLKKAISLCHYPFDQTMLLINNVSDPVKVGKYAERLVQAGVLSSFVFVADHADRTLSSFECPRESFEKGYYYSISELVAIHLCETDYLLHFSSDSMMASKEDWIEDALAKMETDERVIVVNPVWNGKFYAAERESVESDEKFFIGHGFSDQCYLIPVSAFDRPIYGETNPESEKNFPAYGGHSFEKRVDAYMRNHGYLRATSKTASYRHKNFSKNRLKKWILTRWG